MGTFYYGSRGELDIEDRLLSHLKIVMLSKLRRQESFAFTWSLDVNHGSGRGTVWISPGIELEFRFSGNRPPAINRAWIQELTHTAERGELTIIPEPSEPGTGNTK